MQLLIQIFGTSPLQQPKNKKKSEGKKIENCYLPGHCVPIHTMHKFYVPLYTPIYPYVPIYIHMDPYIPIFTFIYTHIYPYIPIFTPICNPYVPYIYPICTHIYPWRAGGQADEQIVAGHTHTLQEFMGFRYSHIWDHLGPFRNIWDHLR